MQWLHTLKYQYTDDLGAFEGSKLMRSFPLVHSGRARLTIWRMRRGMWHCSLSAVAKHDYKYWLSLTSLFFGLLWWTSWAITSYMVVRCSRNRLNDSVEDMVQPPPIFPRAMNIMNPCCLVEPTIQRRMCSNLLASHQKIRKLQDMDQTWSDNTSQSSHRSRLRHHRCFGYHGCRFGWFKLQTVWTSRMMNYPSKAPVPKWPCATVNTGGQRSERPRSMDCLDYV